MALLDILSFFFSQLFSNTEELETVVFIWPLQQAVVGFCVILCSCFTIFSGVSLLSWCLSSIFSVVCHQLVKRTTESKSVFQIL